MFNASVFGVHGDGSFTGRNGFEKGFNNAPLFACKLNGGFPISRMFHTLTINILARNRIGSVGAFILATAVGNSRWFCQAVPSRAPLFLCAKENETRLGHQ